MEIKQISCILAIAEEGSITRAAEKLYMTQSALNQQLLRLEREVGVELFDRNGRGVTPTFAGRIYLENARKILELRNETYKQLGDISEVKYGEISIGYTPERGVTDFARLYVAFHPRYPGISFSVEEARSLQLCQLVLQRKITMAMISYDEELPELVYHHPSREHIIVAVPVSSPLAKRAGENSWQALPIIPLEALKDENMILSSRKTRMRLILDGAFERAGIQPKILLESSVSRMLISLAENQMGIAFLPQAYAGPSDRLVYFRLEEDIYWKVAMVTHRSTYLNKAERDFIALYASFHSGEPETNTGEKTAP